MSERTPLDWALVAVAAATIKASEVTVVANERDIILPALSIGDTLIYKERCPHDRPKYWPQQQWIVGTCPFPTLAEALAEAVCQEVYRRVEEALGTGGLAT